MQHVVLFGRVLTYFQGKSFGRCFDLDNFFEKIYIVLYWYDMIRWKLFERNKIDFYMIYNICKENY